MAAGNVMAGGPTRLPQSGMQNLSASLNAFNDRVKYVAREENDFLYNRTFELYILNKKGEEIYRASASSKGKRALFPVSKCIINSALWDFPKNIRLKHLSLNLETCES